MLVMSEERVADIVLNVKVPQKQSKKATKIELFLARQFEVNWSIDSRTKFSPDVPIRFSDRRSFWDSELYRVRVNGRWFMPQGKYCFFPLTRVVGLIEEATT